MIRDFFDWFRSAHPEDRKKVSWLIFTGIFVSFLGVVAVVFVLKKQASEKRETINHQEVSHLETQNQAVLDEKLVYEVNKVSMAVMNKKGTRTAYAQFSLILSCPDEKSVQTMTMSRAKLLDGIFSVGSQFFLDDFVGDAAPESFAKFKRLLLDQYKNEFHAQAPKELVLKDWTLN